MSRPPRAISRRLVLGLAGVLLGALLVSGAVGVVALRHLLADSADEQVEAALDVVAARAAGPDAVLPEAALRRLVPPGTVVAAARGDAVVLAVAGDGTPTPRDLTGVEQVEAGAPPTGLRWDGRTVRVGAVATTGLTIRLDTSTASDPADPAGAAGSASAAGAAGGAAASGATTDVRVDRVLVAVDTTGDRRLVTRLLGIEVAAGLVLLVVVVASAAAVVHRGLAPVRGLAQAARAVGERTPGAVLPLDQPDAETHELAVALQDALQRRAQAEDRVRAFVQDASHELRTPLTIVHGWADLYLQGGLDGERLDRAMVRVEAETTRMRHLVEQMALLARLDEDVPVRRDRVDLLGVLREVSDDLAVVAPDRSVQVVGDRADGPCDVLGDRERLLQVVHNLVGNAVRHTPPGTQVTVGARAVDGTVVLDVVDDGPGLPERVRGRAFDRFARGDAPTSGSGLGLAVVHAVVGAHGGSVDLVAAERGTHVRVVLPAA